jgi:hypothetical protein
MVGMLSGDMSVREHMAPFGVVSVTPYTWALV